MSQQVDTPFKMFTAASALEEYRRVKMTTTLTVGYAGAAESCIGVTQHAAAAGEQVCVKMLVSGGTYKISCSDAVTLSSGSKALYGTANGQVDSSAAGVAQFTAIQAADGAGSVVEALAVLEPGTSTVASRVCNVTLDRVKKLTLLELAATAGSSLLGLSAGTHGTHAPMLIGEAASGNSKTNEGRFLFTLPENYTAATNLVLRMHAKVTGNLQVSQTIDASVYESDKEGAAGGSPTDLCATAAQALTSSWADYNFTITGTNLVAGDVIDVKVTLAIDDTGGTANKLAEIGDIRILLTETVVP